MTYDEAIQFIRMVCAERIQHLAESRQPACAIAVSNTCEAAFAAIAKPTEEAPQEINQ